MPVFEENITREYVLAEIAVAKETRDIVDIARAAWAANEYNGFNGLEAAADKSTYLGNNLMLAVGELAEAQEELRAGHAPAEVYYGPDGKPEGFLVEVYDAIIRLLGVAAEIAKAGQDGSLPKDPHEGIIEKLEYNIGRGYRHGGKQF